MQTYQLIPGKYELTSLLISSKKTVDIKSVFQELNIFEDLYSPTISGNIVVQDANNMISGSYGLPILGNEYIRIEVKVPSVDLSGPENSFQKTGEFKERNIILLGRIVDIEARRLLTERSQQYIIHFVQEEIITDKKTRISKSFKNKTYKKIISNILSEISPGNQNIELEDTRNTYNLVVPNWHPFKAINWMTSRALSPKHDTMFFFYSTVYNKNAKESNNTSNYFKLKSLAEMLIAPIARKVFFQPKNTDTVKDDKDPRRFSSLETYEITNSFDVLQNLDAGFYASKLYTHDIINKYYSIYDFNYEKSFPKFAHTNRGKLLGLLPDRFGKSFSDYPNQALRLYSTDNALSKNYINEVVGRNLNQAASLNNFRLKFYLPGDGKLSVGDLIYFDIPSPEKVTVDPKNDVFYSGKYLVTAIRHQFISEKYYLAVECVKESLNIDVKDFVPTNG